MPCSWCRDRAVRPSALLLLGTGLMYKNMPGGVATAGTACPLDGHHETTEHSSTHYPFPLYVQNLCVTKEDGRAGGRVHPLPPSRCPRVAALLSTLASQGLVSVVGGDANAEVFVKWKSERKCALIVNMKMFNKGCKYKARPFKLPSLEGLAVLLRDLGKRGGGAGGGGLWGTKLDIANCYWSVEPPPPPWRAPSGWQPKGARTLFCACLLAGTRRLGWSRPSFRTCWGIWGGRGWWWYST